MPSQNLPKPNLPGQLQAKQVVMEPPATPAAPVKPATPVTPATPPVLATGDDAPNQTVFSAPVPSSPLSSQPLQQTPQPQVKAQVVPAGLSRENPGGTPPKMSVVAPVGSLTQANTAAPVNPAAPLAAPSQTRPASPLNQISLNQSKPPVADVPPAMPTQQLASMPKPPIQNTPSATPASVPSTSSTPASAAPVASTANTALSPKPKFKLPLVAMIIGGIVVLVLLAWLAWSALKPKTNPSTNSSTTKTTTGTNANNPTSGGEATTPSTTLTYWGLWEDSQILKEVIADFESKNPAIKVDYRKQSHRDYRERLQQAIASGSGPDIFRYHVAWVPMLSADLSPLPSVVMSTAEYKQIFYPTAFNNLQVNGQIVGIPLMYDGLALLYNKEMLRTANIEVPKTWAELRSAATKLTVPANISERQGGNITRSGLAIGNAGNVDHFSDILALLIVQNGGTPTDPTSQYVKDAVTFYTNFIKQDKVWSDRLANSTTAFAKGDVAMIFAPSWRIHDIKNSNPELDFGVARLPQLDSEKPITWATFWAEGVSAKSKNKDAAWAFLKYMSSPEVLRKFYTDASQYRAFGEIYPRTDMATELQSSDLVAAYITDAPLAKSWYLSSFTHDNGLNDQISKYYEDAINAVLSGTNVDKALETAKTGVTTVLNKYSSKAN